MDQVFNTIDFGAKQDIGLPPIHDPAYSEYAGLCAYKMSTEYYEELKSVARSRRRKAGSDPDFRTTEILHEGFIKIIEKENWKNREHFFGSAALAMRHVITDNARRNLSAKRGSGLKPLPLEEDLVASDDLGLPPEETLAVSTLLKKLGEMDPILARVVDCLYFAGYTQGETADVLGISKSTVQRHWRKAEAWLRAMLTEPETG